jgi:tetratricopeptide (TPR) repeat protein
LIAAGDLGNARQKAAELFSRARSAPDRNNLALAHWYLARIAVDEGNLAEAASNLSDAITLLDEAELPHTAWRVYQTAGQFYARGGDAGKAADFMSRRDRLIEFLASNFDSGDSMQLALQAVASVQ